MKRLSTDTGDFIRRVEQALEALGAARQADMDGQLSPAVLAEAVRQFLDIVRRAEADFQARRDALAEDAITGVGEHGLQLLAELYRSASHAGHAEAAQQIESAILELGLWVARRGGELHALQLLTDTLAHFANHAHDPDVLYQLSQVTAEIIRAVPAAIKQDPDKSNPGRPWRIMLLNYGIVATRSYDPAQMEQAFDTLLVHLPEDIADFFAEGMRQMEALDYPPQVRAVMARYHQRWTQKILH